MNDHEVLLVLGPMVLLLAIACEVAWRNRYVPQWIARKVLHVGAVGACAVVPLWLEDLDLLRWIVIASEIVIILLVFTGRLFDQRTGRRSWGIVLFPLPFLLLLIIEPERWLIALPMAILACSDAMAAVAGNLLTTDRFRLTGDPKSVHGSVAFFIVTLIVVSFFPQVESLIGNLPPWQRWALLIVIAALLTAIEALGSRGLDNLLIPLAAWFLFDHVAEMPLEFRSHVAFETGPALIAAAVIVPVLVRSKLLDVGGAIAAATIGIWTVFFAGAIWLVPLFVFLLLSALIGKWSRNSRLFPIEEKHGRARDAMQVICNGGIFALSAAMFDPVTATFAMAVSISISMCDTWASEIGIGFRKATIDLRNFKRITPGLSGGISLPGTLGGAIGAAIMAGCSVMLIKTTDNWRLFVVIAAAGFAGMIADGLIGAWFQRRYRGNDHRLSDVPDLRSEKVSGLSWMDNDLVNLLSNALITFAAVALWIAA